MPAIASRAPTGLRQILAVRKGSRGWTWQKLGTGERAWYRRGMRHGLWPSRLHQRGLRFVKPTGADTKGTPHGLHRHAAGPSATLRGYAARATLGAAAAWTLALAGCGTDPVNPDGCRQIETARCVAAPSCPAFGANFNVEACKRFYKDQCLRGLQTSRDPGEPQIRACSNAIAQAGQCASEGTSPCVIDNHPVDDPCAVVTAPEHFPSCSFLYPQDQADAGMGTDATTTDANSTPDSNTDAQSGPGQPDAPK